MRFFSDDFDDDWIYVGVDPPFENRWSNARVDRDGIIHIERGPK